MAGRDSKAKTTSNKEVVSNVVRLHETETMAILKSLMKMAESGTLNKLIVAGFTEDGLIATARGSVNIIDQQSLVSYLQSDVTFRIINQRMESDQN